MRQSCRCDRDGGESRHRRCGAGRSASARSCLRQVKSWLVLTPYRRATPCPPPPAQRLGDQAALVLLRPAPACLPPEDLDLRHPLAPRTGLTTPRQTSRSGHPPDPRHATRRPSPDGSSPDSTNRGSGRSASSRGGVAWHLSWQKVRGSGTTRSRTTPGSPRSAASMGASSAPHWPFPSRSAAWPPSPHVAQGRAGAAGLVRRRRPRRPARAGRQGRWRAKPAGGRQDFRAGATSAARRAPAHHAPIARALAAGAGASSRPAGHLQHREAVLPDHAVIVGGDHHVP